MRHGTQVELGPDISGGLINNNDKLSCLVITAVVAELLDGARDPCDDWCSTLLSSLSHEGCA